MKDKLAILITVFIFLTFTTTIAACSNYETKPYYGTYQPIGSGVNITIDDRGFTWGETIQYTFDNTSNEISFNDYSLKFKLFNDYTVLASGQVSWTNFDFVDYGDGTIYLRCERFKMNYSLDEVLIANRDGTFTYFNSAPLASVEGTYKYKDRFVKFNSDILGGTYIAEKTTYGAVWIKDYDTFWDNYSNPYETFSPTEPIDPNEPEQPPEMVDYGYFTTFVYKYGQSVLDLYIEAYRDNYNCTFEVFNQEKTYSFFEQSELIWYINIADIRSALFLKFEKISSDSTDTAETIYWFFAFKLNKEFLDYKINYNDSSGALCQITLYPFERDYTIYYVDYLE